MEWDIINGEGRVSVDSNDVGRGRSCRKRGGRRRNLKRGRNRQERGELELVREREIKSGY